MTSSFRAIAVVLALSGMILRALLPAGWMPNADGVPGTALVICSIDGVHHVPARDDPSGKPDGHTFACPFAAAAHLAPPQWDVALAAPTLMDWQAVIFPAGFAFSGRAVLAHAPRGPPSFV